MLNTNNYQTGCLPLHTLTQNFNSIIVTTAVLLIKSSSLSGDARESVGLSCQADGTRCLVCLHTQTPECGCRGMLGVPEAVLVLEVKLACLAAPGMSLYFSQSSFTALLWPLKICSRACLAVL